MITFLFLRKLGDSNPRYGNPHVSLANWWFQPLTQTSLLPWKFLGRTKCFSQLRCKGSAFFLIMQILRLFFLIFFVRKNL